MTSVAPIPARGSGSRVARPRMTIERKRCPKPTSTTPCARRAGAASRTARCTRSRALRLAETALRALSDAQRARHPARRRRHPRLRRSGRRGGRRHRPRRGARRRLRRPRAGRADQPLLRLRARRGELRRRAGHGRPARPGGRRRRRIDEPRRHGRLGRRLAGRSRHRDPVLFHAAGHLGRPDRHQIRLLARRCRRLRGRIAEARRARLGRGPLRELRRAGEGRQRHHDPRPRTSTCGPTTDMQSLGQLKPSFVQMGEMGGFDAVAIAGPSGGGEASSTCIMPAIPPASSTAPPRCWSARRRPARPRA